MQIEIESHRQQVAETTILSLAEAVESFSVNNRRWPEVLGELTDCDFYLHGYFDRDSIPADPWGAPYQYAPPPVGTRTPRIASLGRDGEPGGQGYDRDITYSGILDGES